MPTKNRKPRNRRCKDDRPHPNHRQPKKKRISHSKGICKLAYDKFQGYKLWCTERNLTTNINNFRKHFNDRYCPTKPFKKHAFSNAIKGLSFKRDQILHNYIMRQSENATLTSLVRDYISLYNNAREEDDCNNSTEWITSAAVNINDQLRLQPNMCPEYVPTNVTREFTKTFRFQNRRLLVENPPNASRATTISATLAAQQAQDHPDLCQTLEVRYIPEISGYGLFATADIPRYTKIDTYRGTNTQYYVRDMLEDNEYVFCSNGRYTNAAHPFSCYARYANENLDSPRDNAKFIHMKLEGNTPSTAPFLKLVAQRNIKAGEEITAAYGADYWYPKIRTHTIPPSLYNKVMATYGRYYRQLTHHNKPGYTPPGMDHVLPSLRDLYQPDTPATNHKGGYDMSYFDDIEDFNEGTHLEPFVTGTTLSEDSEPEFEDSSDSDYA